MLVWQERVAATQNQTGRRLCDKRHIQSCRHRRLHRVLEQSLVLMEYHCT